MSEEGSSDTQPPSESKTEETCLFKDQHEQVPTQTPLLDTVLKTWNSCTDLKQVDNSVHASKETKEEKKISEASIKKGQNLKSSIPRLASNRTPSTIGKPTQLPSSTSNRKLESSLKTLLQKPQAKERQSLIMNPSKVKPNSSQRSNTKSLVRSSNQSSPLHDTSPTRIYISEKKKFDNLLNELVEKQEEILKIHSKLTNLKDKVSLANEKDKELLYVKDLKLVDLRDVLFEKNAHMEGHIVMPFQNTKDGLIELEKRLYDLPKATVKFCENMFHQREDVVKWLSEVNNSTMYKNEGFSEDLSKHIEAYNFEGSGLLEHLQVLENQQAELIGGIARDYSTLFGRAQQLQDDNVRLKKAQQHDTYTLEQQIDLLQKENRRVTDQLTLTTNTLETEREQYKRELSNKTATDRNIFCEKNRINDVKNTIKSLEGKVSQFETKYKELLTASKKRDLSKPDSDGVKKARELQQYKDQVEAKNTEIARQREQYEGQLNECKNRIYELEMAKAEEKELKEAAQAELDNKVHHLQNLQTQYDSLSELVEANEVKHKTNDQESSNAYLKLKEQVEKLMDEATVKDKEILSLNAKLRELEREMKDDGSTYSTSLMAKIRELEDTVSSLKTQLEDAEHTLKDTQKKKELIENDLMKKTMELEQRDLILKEKTKIAELREELVTTLKSREHHQEVCVQNLKAAIMVKESENEILTFDCNTNKQTSTSFMDVAKTSSGLVTEMTIKSKRAAELYTNLEQKHLELVQLQRRVRELEDRNETSEKLRIRHEARINHLEQALGEKCLTQPGCHRQSEKYQYGIDQYLECRKNVGKCLQNYCMTIKMFVVPDLEVHKDDLNIENESCQQKPSKLIEVKRKAESLLENVMRKDSEIVRLSAQLRKMKSEVQALAAAQSSPMLWRVKSLVETLTALYIQLETVETKMQETVREKERMEFDLMKKTIELEQRDSLALKQTKLCMVSEKLMDVLQNEELSETKDFVDNLLSAMAALREFNTELFLADGTPKRKYSSALEFLNSVSGLKEEKLFQPEKRKKNLHTYLEDKSIQLTQLQQRLQELEKKNKYHEEMRIVQEMCISDLENQLYENDTGFQFD